MGIRTGNLFLLIIWCFLLCHRRCSSMQTFLRQGETLKYPDELFSESGKFVLRFFPPTLKVHLGLFYNTKNMMSYEPLWVANRNAEDLDGSANLTLGIDGSLKISYEGGRSFVLYSSQAPSNSSSSVVLQDDGNLVLREYISDGSSKQDLWQSFDHPTDTLLPGMKLGFNNKTRKSLTVVSQRHWQDYRSGSWQDYRSGSYILGVDPSKMNQLVIWWLGDIFWKSGPWENGNFTSLTAMSRNENVKFHYVSNENESYFTFSLFGDLFNPRLILSYYGGLALFTSDPTDRTDYLVDCPDYYNYNYRDNGCVENFQNCSEKGFYVSDSRWGIMFSNGTKMRKNLTEEDCQHKCYNNCSCVAYAYVNDTCVIWSNGSKFQKASELDGGQLITFKSKDQRPELLDPVVLTSTWLIITLGGALFIMISCCYVRCKRKVARRKQRILLQEIGCDGLPFSTKRKKENKTERELHIFTFKTIVSATKNFSHENQLGKGGYGQVYKVKFLYTFRMDEDGTTTTIQIIMRINFQGRLPDGQEIAIKRLSTSSTQGLVEFKKEVIFIAKLQHTNLVRLLGFCVQGEEKILVYEYMPNKSLDFFLFESARKKILNWKKRFIIIEGIAQGLVYLHKYSRLKVIHRDLKASNILLDLEMNPKISDFGMARLLGPEDSEENTNRIVGTFGYMPPEYALQGTVSTKTDVFSFGILLLEIVSGRKNNSRYHPTHPLNLTGYAWTLWKEGNGVELIDPSLDESVPRDEIMKCIQIGLLCVQEQASNRPPMIDVVFMLSTENAQLPLPRKPAFFISSIEETPEEAQTQVEIFSINELTMSNMEVR